MKKTSNNQHENTRTGQPKPGNGDNTQVPKAEMRVNYWLIALGLVLIGYCTYQIFISQDQIDTFRQVVISVLLCLGCGLVATAFSGGFKTQALTVTGSVGITCFFLFAMMEKIQPNQVDQRDKKYRNFYESFSNLSGIDLALQVRDSLGKSLLEVNDAKELSDFISGLSYKPMTKELIYEFLLEDSTIRRKAKEILILLKKDVYSRIIDANKVAHYNRDIWGNIRKPEYPEYVVLSTPFEKSIKLTITLIK